MTKSPACTTSLTPHAACYSSYGVSLMEENKEEDWLERMMRKQHEFQLGMDQDIQTQQYYSTMTLALIDEAMEALRETPWKPWKKNQTCRKERVHEELADVFIFYLNLCLSAGMTAKDLKREFTVKHIKNIERQRNGY
jgi:dimeric dUTPase (all-alpha-NTP-PPase superfamily)